MRDRCATNLLEHRMYIRRGRGITFTVPSSSTVPRDRAISSLRKRLRWIKDILALLLRIFIEVGIYVFVQSRFKIFPGLSIRYKKMNIARFMHVSTGVDQLQSRFYSNS